MITGKNRWRPDAAIKDFRRIFGQTTFIPVVNDEEIAKQHLLSRTDGLKIIFCDTETTGINFEEDRIIQYSAIKYRLLGGCLYIEETLDQYIKSSIPIPPEASKVNHITEETLKDAPTEEEGYHIIKDFMDGLDAFIAYNTPFDLAMIKSMYKRFGDEFKPPMKFDVMAMFIDLVTMYQCQSRKLCSAAKYLKLDTDVSFHNALDDIIMTTKVFAALVEKYQELNPQTYEGTKQLNITNSWSWTNPSKQTMQRIYFSTREGNLFFEKFDRSFGVDTKSDLKLQDIDMNFFVKQAFLTYGVRSMEELSHLKQA